MESSQSSNSVSKISQVVNDKDRKLMETEAYINYSKLSIRQLEKMTKELNDKTKHLQDETEANQKEIKALDVSIEIGRKSLEHKFDMYMNLKPEINKLEAEIKQEANHNDTVYNELLEKYKKTRKIYETYHPLYQEVKELKIENLRREVQFKMSQAEIADKKYQIEQRRDIHKKILYAPIIKFSENTLRYWKSRDLAQQLATEEKVEADLTKQLEQLNILAAQKDKELRMSKWTPDSKKSSAANKNMECTADQNWTDINSSFAVPLPIPFTSQSTAFNPLADSRNQEELLHKLRARCEQRQQHWEKQRSFTSQKKQTLPPTYKNLQIRGQGPLLQNVNIKRPLQPANLQSQIPQFKMAKTIPAYSAVRKENYPFYHQPEIEKMNHIPVSADNEKRPLNIISVHNLGNSDNSVLTNQQSNVKPVMSQDINQGLPQQKPHSLAQSSQNYPSKNISQIQSQETTKKLLLPAVNVDTPKQQFYEHHLAHSQMLPGSINLDATRNPSHQIPQTPLHFGPEIAAAQSQSGLKLTQEMPQSNMVQNLMFLNEKQPSMTQASIGTSQSSTFSQKYREYQGFLNDVSQTHPSTSQNPTVVPVSTSSFFNNLKPRETTAMELDRIDGLPEPLCGNESDPTQFLNDSAMYLDTTMNPAEDDFDYSSALLSPEYPVYNENGMIPANTQPQPSGMFNFGQAPTTHMSIF